MGVADAIEQHVFSRSPDALSGALQPSSDLQPGKR
jgi:hypothetical protein